MKMLMLNKIVAVVRQSHTSADGSLWFICGYALLRGVNLGVNLGFVAPKSMGHEGMELWVTRLEGVS